MAAREYTVRIPARLLKDRTLSPDARYLRVQLTAYADARSGKTYVSGKRLQEDLRWGRRKREKAQAELCAAGWLRKLWKRGQHARFGKLVYVVCTPFPATAQFQRSGESEQLISSHSQSQVRSEVTILTTKRRENLPLE